MNNRIFYLLLVGIVIIIVIALVIRFITPKTVVSGNSISPKKLEELKQEAEAGDPAAQYVLTLFVDDPIQRDLLLKKSAEAGYPPAVVTHADMMQNKTGSAESRIMLEKVAKNGFYPAIDSLARCIERGSCGVPSQKDALVWTIVSRLLVEDNKLKSNELSEGEKRLRIGLTASELQAAQSDARSIADKITKVTNY